MGDVTKRFRWGDSMLAIEHHFSTPEIKAINKACRKLIEDFVDPDAEGYRCTIMPLPLFEYGLVLAYSFEEELWVLEVAELPDWGSPDCKRKPPKGPRGRRGSKRQVHGEAANWRNSGLASLTDKLGVLYKTLTTLVAGPTITAFWRDTSTMRGLRSFIAQISRYPIPLRAHERVVHVIEEFRHLADLQSRGCKNVVQLVRGRVNEVLWFLRPLSTYQGSRLQHARRDGLWDAALFGAL